MQLSEDYSDNISIQCYEDDCISIMGTDYKQNIIINRSSVQAWNIDLANLHEQDFEFVITQAPEIFIFGTGKKRINIHSEYIAALLKKGIGVEIMDTGAACRTFTILSAENRDVVAGLIIN